MVSRTVPPENQDLSPTEASIFDSLPSHPIQVYPIGTGLAFSGVKQLRNDANDSCSSDAEILKRLQQYLHKKAKVHRRLQ
jgi:hypothetical protein